MLDYNLPLCAEEAAFAAEHHSLIYKYLHKHKLPENEFYDIAVFGYLRAVRKYLARPELRQYQFSTVAFRAMSCNVHHSKEYWQRKKRQAMVEQYQDDLHTDDLGDPVSAAYENVVSFEELTKKLTPLQWKIAVLRSDGYRDKEIAAICQMKLCDLEQEMDQAQANILYFPTETAAVAA